MRAARKVSSQIRKALPESFTTVVRRVATVWGTATASWRMSPDFVIAGAQRAGTTTLFRMLSDHPQVVRPTLNKGVAYFDLNYERGWAWYLGHFPVRAVAELTRRTKNVVTFESSGYYMFHPLAPGRIARDLPQAKIVVLLRNPADRAHSAHRHEQRRGFETEDFEAALDLESSRIEGEMEKIVANPGYASYALQHHAYVSRGQYDEQIERLADAVGLERIYVIDADRFFENPADEFAALCRWLGLAKPEKSNDPQAWNAAPRAPLSDHVRRRLDEHFTPHDRRLAEILGRSLSWRSGEMPRDQ